MMHTSPPRCESVHGTCISIGSVGVVLTGASGSGKSDLALRCIGRGAGLVADDKVVLTSAEGLLTASADAAIRGLLEVRGVGLVRYPVAQNVPVRLVVELVEPNAVERLPQPRSVTWLGHHIPVIAIYGFAASAPHKIYAAIHALHKGNLHTGFLPDKE